MMLAAVTVSPLLLLDGHGTLSSIPLPIYWCRAVDGGDVFCPPVLDLGPSHTQGDDDAGKCLPQSCNRLR